MFIEYKTMKPAAQMCFCDLQASASEESEAAAGRRSWKAKDGAQRRLEFQNPGQRTHTTAAMHQQACFPPSELLRYGFNWGDKERQARAVVQDYVEQCSGNTRCKVSFSNLCIPLPTCHVSTGKCS